MLRRWEFTELIYVLGIMICLLCFVQSDSNGDEIKSDPNGDKIKQLLYKTKVTEEETSSHHIPDEYLCDACTGVAYSLGQVFMEAERTYIKRQLTESSLIDKVENLCENETHWTDYGLKEIDGVKRFTGPGTETEDDWGLQIEGDFWPYRLVDLCWRLVGELETLDLYNSFKNGNLEDMLCFTGKKRYCTEPKKPKKISDEL